MKKKKKIKNLNLIKFSSNFLFTKKKKIWWFREKVKHQKKTVSCIQNLVQPSGKLTWLIQQIDSIL